MAEPKVIYRPRADATPESERSTLMAAYRYVICDCHASEKGARPGAATMRKDSGMTAPTQKLYLNSSADPSALPVTFTGNELPNKEFPPIKWAVADLLPAGVTLFGGREKMGKSWLSFSVGIAEATGGRGRLERRPPAPAQMPNSSTPSRATATSRRTPSAQRPTRFAFLLRRRTR